ncbi:MAG TPA: hypothetical protein VND93_12250 [Myxococcales bacterium]|nr:hypothetical protein [Myxococcales bacterium]
MSNTIPPFPPPPPPPPPGATQRGGAQFQQGGQPFGFGGGQQQQLGFSGRSSFQPSPGGAGQAGQGARLPPPELLRDLSKALQMPPQALAQKLLSGQSLPQVASSLGISGQDLHSKISQFVQTRMPNLSANQVSQMANGIMAGQPPPPLRQSQGATAG